MKPSEFKKILKPLIKQTVREVILEEGILSNIVSEVARGLQSNLVVETSDNEKTTGAQDIKRREQEYEKQRQERIRRLNESSKSNIGIDIFQGTKEIADTTTGPLGGVTATDGGVDISGIEKLANGKWKRLI